VAGIEEIEVMASHWGDDVATRTKIRGPLVLGIDPVASDTPTAISGAGHEASWLGQYADFVMTALAQHVGFVKFQSAFFEAYGAAGVTELARAIARARQLDIGIIVDVKRGDIGSTADAYARAYLTPRDRGGSSDLEADCITVNPFLGPDSVEPFVICAQRYGKGVFVLAKTSNPGSGWLQDQQIGTDTVSARVARQIDRWSQTTRGTSGWGSVGAVVGATYPDEGKHLRTLMPTSILLVPGIGAQGGSLELVRALHGTNGAGVLVPVSRGLTRIDNPTISLSAYGDVLVKRAEALRSSLMTG
jgi:orotidine-5'-phosphate decarboxylase